MSTRKSVKPKIRCAIYTRKSTDENLDMDFNTLDAQREACGAFITSQKSEGWFLIPDRYDDGGFSGGTLERPALERLLGDIEAGLVNVVVVYKIDRLTRALLDFAKLVEMFDKNEVTFASVTQSFNTTTSMGRLTLNVLLSFAQFEREISAERIRDKFAASKKKGMWMGGHVPLGYRVDNRKLIIVPQEAEQVQYIFQQYLKIGSATQLVKKLGEKGILAKNGNRMDRGYLYRVLANRLYIGEIVHGEESYPGQHDGIIDRELWNQVHTDLVANTRKKGPSKRVQSEALLKGIMHCRHCGRAMSPTHTRKSGRLYRYYVCQNAAKNGHFSCPLKNIAAGDIEAVVIQQVRTMLQTPEMVVKAWKAEKGLRKRDVIEALKLLEPVWEELLPVEQQRLIQLLIARVDVHKESVQIHLRSEGLDTLANELKDLWNEKQEEAAA
ncbi:MAG: recombinase family protein [Magnetococcales bacterium]|nr:recombinase family protein [Magnetococcales bacterium]